ncbi:MAG: hypothetical protein ACE5JZ_13260 [Kiloniellales bacterium]
MTRPLPVRAMSVPVLFALALAIDSASAQQRFADITFAHKPPIKLDVARVELVKEFQSPEAPPNVEHRFPIPPDRAVERWARDRLQPVGAGNVARVVIKQSSVVEVPLETSGGLVGLFTTEQSERYDAVLEVLVEIHSDLGRQGYAAATVKRSQTVPEDISPNDLQQVWFEMTEKLIKDIDSSLEESIPKYLAAYLR